MLRRRVVEVVRAAQDPDEDELGGELLDEEEQEGQPDVSSRKRRRVEERERERT